MDDNYIKNLFLTKSKHLNKNYTQCSWLNKHNDIFNYLLNKYSDSTSIQETLYRIINNVHERPVCNVCGKPVKFKCFSRGFSKHCSRKCVMTDSLIQNKIKDTCLNRYGVTHPMHIENVKNKIKETCLKRYNVTSFTKTEEFKTKLKQTCLLKYGVESTSLLESVKLKSKQTCLLKYGVEYSFLSENNKLKTIETNLKKYNVTNPAKNEIIKNKVKNTKLKLYNDPYFNNKEKTYKTIINKYGSLDTYYKYRFDNYVKSIKKNKNKGMTLIELKTYNYLLTLFDKSDILFNIIVDERYPFHVDFYIKSKDLFIEINAFWTHGKHKFDSNNIDDLKLLELWKQKAINSKQYLAAIKIWTEIDPLKIETSINNHLNYLPIWSNKIEEVKCIINNYFEN